MPLCVRVEPCLLRQDQRNGLGQSGQLHHKHFGPPAGRILFYAMRHETLKLPIGPPGAARPRVPRPRTFRGRFRSRARVVFFNSIEAAMATKAIKIAKIVFHEAIVATNSIFGSEIHSLLLE